MDILNTLKNQENKLYLEDLDFYEDELTAGDYDDVYVRECREEIQLIRRRLSENFPIPTPEVKPVMRTESTNGTLLVGLNTLMPEGVVSPSDEVNDTERIRHHIIAMRKLKTHKSDFKEYINQENALTESFIDDYFAFFDITEMDILLTVKQLSEAFLEKYFGVLNLNKVARHQQFSEKFYIKHFSQLDTLTVLDKGKNAWRKKENRSKELDVFLRLKGVNV